MEGDVVYEVGSSTTAVSLMVIAIPLLIAVLLWLALARSTFIQGDDMERPNRVAQLYGYAVCLIAVIVFLVSANSFIENVFSLANPLRGSGNRFGERSVTSFEAYRASANSEVRVTGAPTAAPATPPSDSVLRARYEALRADRIAQSRFDAERGLTSSGLLLILCIVLFALHWRWLRSATPTPEPLR